MASIFSFFSGFGFLDLGFDTTGFDIVYVNEIHKPFLDTYKFSREKLGLNTPSFGYKNCSIEELFVGKQKKELLETVKKLKGNELVGFIGGPPCPDFSVGGKNKGKHGENGRLSHSYIEMITQLKPDFFLFENVRGLWRTKKHRAFYEELKMDLIKSGYILSERLINAIEYGVPQDRERIILFGTYSSLVREQQLEFDFETKTFKEKQFPWKKYSSYKREEVFNYKWPTLTKFKLNSILPSPGNIPIELTVQYWFEKNNVSNHPNSNHYFQPRAGLEKFMSIMEGDVSRKSYKRLHRWRYSPTVAYGNNEVHLHPYQSRRISAAEALSIQSIPKEFMLPEDLSLTNMFKGIGNGVPYLTARSIAKSIKHFLGE